jgi:hypothetical protein
MSNISYLTDEIKQAAANLPTSYETRWTNARKAAVVHAVQTGVISLDRALALYRMSAHEFENWRKACAPLGQPYAGLRQLRHTSAAPREVPRHEQPVLRPIM